MDAFLRKLTKERDNANPPFNLITRLLAMVKRQRARLTVVLPAWEVQPWWPLLAEMLIAPPDSSSSPVRHFLAGTPGERTSDGGPTIDGHRGDDIRRALLHRGFPDAVARAMSAKWCNIHTIRG